MHQKVENFIFENEYGVGKGAVFYTWGYHTSKWTPGLYLTPHDVPPVEHNIGTPRVS